MNIYFASLTKTLQIEKRTIWATSGIKLETGCEDDMNNILFDLDQENIQLSKKIIAMLATDIPAFLIHKYLGISWICQTPTEVWAEI